MKQITITGHTLEDGRFKVAFASHGQDQSRLGRYDDWNTLIQTLRLRNKNPLDSKHKGFTYTFPLVFGN